jgi:hypothetical protein
MVMALTEMWQLPPRHARRQPPQSCLQSKYCPNHLPTLLPLFRRGGSQERYIDIVEKISVVLLPCLPELQKCSDQGLKEKGREQFWQGAVLAKKDILHHSKEKREKKLIE